MDYSKIPVDGSTRFDDDIMNSIEPFNYKELEEYNHAYLSGFFAEKYDVDLVMFCWKIITVCFHHHRYLLDQVHPNNHSIRRHKKTKDKLFNSQK